MQQRQDDTAVASKTYRSVNKGLAATIGVPVKHTKYPSDDFADLLDKVDDRAKAMALRWYELGIKRGISFAIDQIVAGNFKLKNGNLTVPHKMEVRVRTRFKGEPWQKRTFRVVAKEVGFTS